MGKQFFFDALAQELRTVRRALLTLLETRERLIYRDAPALRRQYIEKFGELEQKTLAAELKALLLTRKLEMVQACLNRREVPDMAEIESRLAAESNAILAKAEADNTLAPTLTEEQQKKLQEQYHAILQDYHPPLHPDLSETEQQLYQKAMEAYRQQDVDTMQLVYDMLYNTFTVGEFSLHLRVVADEDAADTSFEMPAELPTADYTLAKKLYPFFVPGAADILLAQTIEKYRAEMEALQAELVEVQGGFPFTVKALLSDADAAEAHRFDLQARLRSSEQEAVTLQQQLDTALEGTRHG